MKTSVGPSSRALCNNKSAMVLYAYKSLISHPYACAKALAINGSSVL